MTFTREVSAERNWRIMCFGNTTKAYCKLILKVSALSVPWQPHHSHTEYGAFISAMRLVVYTSCDCYRLLFLLASDVPEMLCWKIHTSVCRKCRRVPDTLTHLGNKKHPVDLVCAVCTRRPELNHQDLLYIFLIWRISCSVPDKPLGNNMGGFKVRKVRWSALGNNAGVQRVWVSE